MNKYDDKNLCPLCNNFNEIYVKDFINTDICEAETFCTVCGHKDYWDYGFYQSKMVEPED